MGQVTLGSTTQVLGQGSLAGASEPINSVLIESGGVTKRMTMNDFVALISASIGTTTTTTPSLLLDATTQDAYSAAITNAAMGSKRQAAANAIVTAMGSVHRLNIYRDGTLIIPATFTGPMTTGTDGINVFVNLGTIATATPIAAGAIATGTWTFAIEGGTGFTRSISGSVGPIGSDVAMTLSDDTAAGYGFAPSLTLIVPRSVDNL